MTTLSISKRQAHHHNMGFARLLDVLALRRQRRQLATLDDRALEDMGLTRADVAAELKRPVWDVPATWRC